MDDSRESNPLPRVCSPSLLNAQATLSAYYDDIRGKKYRFINIFMSHTECQFILSWMDPAKRKISLMIICFTQSYLVDQFYCKADLFVLRTEYHIEL